MRQLTYVLSGLSTVCVLTAGTAAGAATVLACDGVMVTVSSESGAEARLACDTAVEVDRRLRSLGLEIAEPVRIEVTETLDVAPGVCVALYSTEAKKLQVLPVDCLDDQPGRAKAFPKMAADLLFESLIVHELVHAYMDQSAEGRFLPTIAHEYLAYAIQLDALPNEERQRILARAEVAGPVDLGAINEALLRLSPIRFAATSWLHFRQEGGNAAVVRRVLDGALTFNSLRE